MILMVGIRQTGLLSAEVPGISCWLFRTGSLALSQSTCTAINDVVFEKQPALPIVEASVNEYI